MEKLKVSIPPFEFVHTVRGLFTGTVHPDALWRFVLGVSGVIGLIIAVFAYLTYTWAGSSDAPVVVPHGTKEMLSADELHTVLEIYRKKNETYRTLLQGHHAPPSLGIDVGIVVPKEGATNTSESTNPEVQPSGTRESVP